MKIFNNFSSRYENHSPSTTAGNGSNAPSSMCGNSNMDRNVKSERNNGNNNEANDDYQDESIDVSVFLNSIINIL